MGNGAWSATTYHDRASMRAASGRDAFDYSRAAIESGRLHPHQTLDPRGLGIRESRDNPEHPQSNAIIISLDVTGSMGAVVRAIHQDLPQLHELLLGHNYIAHPQIMFAAVGDATCDMVPLQVGQFESDNRMDQNLENMILEGGGGGQKTESYELMLYVAARHTAIDCWEKRRKKGYLFMIGDEMAYPIVKQSEIAKLIGPGLQSDIPLAQIIDDVRQRYHLFYVIPGGAAHGADTQVLKFWKDHLGPHHVILLESPEDVSECIALAIGMNEGAIDESQGVAQLGRRGTVSRAMERIAKALASLVGAQKSDSSPSSRPRRL